MKLRRLGRTLLTGALMLLILLMSVGSAFAAQDGVSAEAEADFEGTVYSLSSGLSVKLPPEYDANALWDGMDDSAPGIAAQGYSDADAAKKWLESLKAELFTYGENEARTSGYMVIVNEQEAPADLSNESLASSVYEWVKEYDPTTAPVCGYGTTEINGISAFKVYGATEAAKQYMYDYIIASDTGMLYHINLWGASVDGTDGYLDKLARDVASAATVSDELRSHVVTLTGEPFAMIEGEYAGAFADNENTAAANVASAAVSGAVGDPNFEGTVYSTQAGISVKLPADYTQLVLWDQMDDAAPGFEKWGYSSAAEAIGSLEAAGNLRLLSYQGDDFQSTTGAFYISELDAPDDLSNDSLYYYAADKLFNSFVDMTRPAYGYGTTEINGIPAFKLYVQMDAASFQDSAYCYIFAVDTGKLYLITFDDFTGDFDDGYHDKLVRDIICTLDVNDELRSHIVTLPGKPFRMRKGDHPGAYTAAECEAAGITVSTAADGTSAAVGTSAASAASAASSSEKPKSLYQKITGFEFPIYLILLALVFILFFGSRLAGKGEWHDDPLSLDTSKAIQGFCAVAIIIHHLAQELMADAGPLYFFEQLGVLFVGVFFFFSGYGLFTSLKSKDNYLKGFLKKRLTTILVPFYVCTLIFVVFACIAGQKFNWKEALAAISGWIMINSHMWYIVEIAVLYLAFFVIYRLIKNRAVATALMTVFVAALTAGSLLLGHGADMSSKFWFQGEWWYNTTFLFILGILVSQNADKLRSFARKTYAVLLPVFAALTVAFGFLTSYAIKTWSYWSETPGNPAYDDKVRCLAFQLPWVLFFVVTLLLIMMKVRFGNPILKFLGSISLELYLIHNLFLQGLSKHGGTMAKITGNSMYILLTILLSVGFAAIISGFDKYIIGLINGKNKKALPSPEQAKRRIHSIDVMRIVMAFLVVTIHIPFMGKAGEVFVTYGKTAVPFFLAVCGYMLYRDDSRQMMKRLGKQTVKILLLYIGSNVLYGLALALQSYMTRGDLSGMKMYFTADSIKNFLLYNVWFSEHLWFLGSLLYALVILLVLNAFKAVRYAMFAAPLLIAAYVVLSYLEVAEPYVLRNALLVGLPYVMMGMLIRRYEDKLAKIKAPVLWLLAAVLCVTAILELNFRPQRTGVPFISCELLVYVILLLCLRYPDFGRDTLAEKMGRELSLPIYILHILPMIFIPMRQPYMTTYGAVTVFVLTALVSVLYVAVKHGAKSLGGSVKHALSGNKEKAIQE